MWQVYVLLMNLSAHVQTELFPIYFSPIWLNAETSALRDLQRT